MSSGWVRRKMSTRSASAASIWACSVSSPRDELRFVEAQPILEGLGRRFANRARIMAEAFDERLEEQNHLPTADRALLNEKVTNAAVTAAARKPPRSCRG